MKKMFIAGTAVCILLTCCRMKSNPVHFVAATPMGRTRLDTLTFDGTKKVRFSPAAGDTIFFAGQSISVFGAEDNDIDEYMNAVYYEVKKRTSFYREEKRQKLSINNYDARWILIRLSTSKNPELIAEQKSYFIKERGTVFMITCTAPDHGIALMQDKIDEVINSFKIEEGKYEKFQLNDLQGGQGR